MNQIGCNVRNISCFKIAKSGWLLLDQLVLSLSSSPDLDGIAAQGHLISDIQCPQAHPAKIGFGKKLEPKY